ncbi:helix-turn-helix domain-containing protein, partial [Campylobacter vicugnae]
VKQMILLYQDILPDTEISKKLGISRKSIWERRKRHDIYRQK